METVNRPDGYYRVKYNDRWIIAQKREITGFPKNSMYWNVIGMPNNFTEDDFDEIGPRIKDANEKNVCFNCLGDTSTLDGCWCQQLAKKQVELDRSKSFAYFLENTSNRLQKDNEKLRREQRLDLAEIERFIGLARGFDDKLSDAVAYIKRMIPCSWCKKMDGCTDWEGCATHRNWREIIENSGSDWR